MRLASVLLARAMVWIESTDLNRRGVPFYPDMIKAIAARYNFVKVPEKIEELDGSKGITFAGGRFGDAVIDQLVFYMYGIVLDTRLSTDKSKQLLQDALEWGSKEFGLVFKIEMAKRWQYSSQLTFYSEVMPSRFPKSLMDLSEQVGLAVRDVMQEELKYEPVSILFDYDQLTRKHPLGPFSIQRRDNTPFSEGKYFSTAPLPTDVHIKLLEDFEELLRLGL